MGMLSKGTSNLCACDGKTNQREGLPVVAYRKFDAALTISRNSPRSSFIEAFSHLSLPEPLNQRLMLPADRANRSCGRDAPSRNQQHLLFHRDFSARPQFVLEAR
jgi:hypothetical protein